MSQTSTATQSKDISDNTSTRDVSQTVNKETSSKTAQPSVSETNEVKEIDLVESGSEDGEIVEIDEVDKEIKGKDNHLIYVKRYDYEFVICPAHLWVQYRILSI